MEAEKAAHQTPPDPNSNRQRKGAFTKAAHQYGQLYGPAYDRTTGTIATRPTKQATMIRTLKCSLNRDHVANQTIRYHPTQYANSTKTALDLMQVGTFKRADLLSLERDARHQGVHKSPVIPSGCRRTQGANLTDKL